MSRSKQPKPRKALVVDCAQSAHDFIAAFEKAPAGTDIEFTLARCGDRDVGPLVMAVQIGPRLFSFTKQEAEIMLEVMTEGIEKFGDPGSLADLVFAMRRGIIELDRQPSAQPPAPNVTRVTPPKGATPK